ncbi:ornithine aminotransferase, mitochondrial [Coccinella septempunctata]|uniref:ornithine aminotransferase, mitochondrial n=1 Tax=Coccinella septempunctata TaxID=41139 RepID=UPI001D092F44|nr:ornithine aminotransferase, mitochondrial [Coccinella septempunctata]XP_044756192.1 ornithine aminotransferase, mitochondrial [Coccinella septempunctata]
MSSTLSRSTRLIKNEIKSHLKIKKRSFSSKEIIQREKQYCAQNYHPLPVVLARGQGVYVWDVEGNKYLDFLSGYSANNFGHCHPKIVETLISQANTLHHTSRAFYNNILSDFAKKITEYFGYDRFLPMNTGVEACETAVKMSRKWGYMQKKIPKNEAKMLFATNNFWGRSIAACSSSTDPTCFEGYGPFLPGFQCIPYDDLTALDIAAQDPLVCGFMVEPIQGESGINVPSDGYLKGVRAICSKYNILWTADEVQTGMGRTGKRLAVDYEDVMPDILVLGKSLGGGVYPVSGCLANDNVMSVIKPGTHGSTFGGNPLASKLGMTTLDILQDENLAENSFKMGEIFRKELEDKINKKIAITVRGKGLFNAIVINRNYAKAWDICLKMKERGLLCKQTHDDIIRFVPPLVINEEQILESTDIIINVINGLK